MRDAIRRRLRGQEGMSLAELVVVLGILGIVLPTTIGVLLSMQQSFQRQSGRSQTNDQARLAVEQLDREIRSGNLLYDPKDESPAYMTVRVYTQTNASTRSPGNRCVQWRIQGGQLQRRDWSTNGFTYADVSPWRVVADHVVNETLSPPLPLFQLDPDPQKGYKCEVDPATGASRCSGRTLIVTVVVNRGGGSGGNVRVQESITGRNTQYGYPQTVCQAVPPA